VGGDECLLLAEQTLCRLDKLFERDLERHATYPIMPGALMPFDLPFNSLNRGTRTFVEDVDNMLQDRLDMPGIVAYAGDADGGIAPKFMIPGLGNRDLEIAAHPIHKAPNHLPFVLQRIAALQAQLDLKRSDDHSGKSSG
jgi:hypothetical protein